MARHQRIGNPAEGTWLALELHCLDVAAAARALLATPVIQSHARRLGLLPPGSFRVALERLLVLVLLHDLGKALPGFQDKVFADHGWDDLATDHVRPVMAALVNGEEYGEPVPAQMADALDLPVLSGWFDDPAGLPRMLVASICHHGGRPEVDGIRMKALATVHDAIGRRSRFGETPEEGWRRLIHVARTIFPGAFTDEVLPAPSEEAVQWFSGLVMIADWMGSDATRFPIGPGEPPSRWKTSAATAEALLAEVGFSATRLLPSGMAALAPPDRARAVSPAILGAFAPRPAQASTLAVPVESRLVLLEAPTGEGKTEAALLRFCVLLLAGEVDGLFFAVPTRSAGFELRHRVEEALSRLSPAIGSRVVSAIGGDAPPETPAGEDGGRDLHDDPGRPYEAAWVMGHMKRRMAAPVVVGTIDQAYLSTLRTKHGQMRGFMLSRMLLVIDEVHAADPFMNQITAALVSRQLANGGHAFLMSATLGASALAEIEAGAGRPARVPAFDEARALPYPLLRHGAPGRLEPVAIHRREDAPPRSVRVELLAREGLAVAVAHALARGARVLVIRSTVRDATTDFLALEAAGLPVLQVNGVGVMHHGRYADADRALLNRELQAAMGKRRPEGEPLVCVATQTAEQSLDIDADLLITDPCPADVLLQRLGRLHRHRRGYRPPGFEDPRALMLDPGDLSLYIGGRPERPTVGRSGMGFAMVYANLLAVKATLDWIAAAGSLIRVPEDCRAIVEAATHGPHLRVLAAGWPHAGGTSWSSFWGWIYGGQAVLRNAAGKGIMPLDAVITDSSTPWLGDAADVRTRLGADRVEIRCQPFTSPLGAGIDWLALPLSVVGAALDAGFDPRKDMATVTPTGSGTHLVSLTGPLVVYDRLGWRRCNKD